MHEFQDTLLMKSTTVNLVAFISRVLGRSPGAFIPAQMGNDATFSWHDMKDEWAVYLSVDGRGIAKLELMDEADLTDMETFAIVGAYDHYVAECQRNA